MSLAPAEIALVVIVVGCQLFFFARTTILVIALSKLYPTNKKEFEIRNQNISNEEAGIAFNVDVIFLRSTWSRSFKRIIVETNDYLIFNRSTIANFEVIKNISERESDKVERSINSLIPIPLYIGLMGTMFGIIYGLFSMGSLENLQDASGLNPLLSGVTVAMTASIFGLFLTLVSSAFTFRWAKLKRDDRRSIYYAFIEQKLFSVLSTDPSSNIARNLSGIEVKLEKFNQTFAQYTDEFQEVVTGTLGTIKKQTGYILQVSRIDFEGISKNLASMYGGIAQNLEAFKVFNNYQLSVNKSMASSEKSIQGIDQVFKRVSTAEQNLTSIFENINQKVTDVEEVMKFIKRQYSGVDEVSAFAGSLIHKHEETMDKMAKSTNELMEKQSQALAGVTDFTKGQLSDQQQQLSEVYKEFKAFLEETKIQFSDWSRSSVADARGEMTELSQQLKKDITDTFDEVKGQVAEVYEDNRLIEIQEDMAQMKATLQRVSKTDESAKHIDRALQQMNKSIDSLSEIARALKASRPNDQFDPWLILKKTALQAGAVAALGMVGYIIYYLLETFVA